MRSTTNSLLEVKTLITFGFRPHQINHLTNVSDSSIIALTKKMQDQGLSIHSKSSLSANKILRTKAHYLQFSLWLKLYKSILIADFNFAKRKVTDPWYSNLDTSSLIKSQIYFNVINESEFGLIADQDESVIGIAECFTILNEINTKEGTYLKTCGECNVQYVVVESSKHTDNCPACSEKIYKLKKRQTMEAYSKLANN